ncbi:MAG: hypothetical protein ACKOGJ_08405, partial [Phycisphaerales bacterium]
MDASTDDRRHALPRVLAAFDRAIGLDSTLRTSVAVAAPAAYVPPKVAMPMALPPAAVTPSAAAPARAASLPESSLLAPGDRAARTAQLAEIAARHAATCPHCTRATGWTNLVFGEGAPDAAVMFVGEAPGETEDRAG